MRPAAELMGRVPLRRTVTMRACVLLLAVLLIPLAVGHGEEVHWEGERLPPGEYLSHSRVWDVALGPDQTVNTTLAFEGGVPLKEGWLILVRAQVAQGPVEATVEQGHTQVAHWSWEPGDHTVTTRSPATEFLTLELHNPGDQNATVKLYFDQTCECTLKGLPMESGPLWFDAPTTEGTEVHYNFSVVTSPLASGAPETPWDGGTMTVRVDLVEASPDGATLQVTDSRQWTFDGDDAQCFPDHPRFNVCLPYSFVASGSGNQALWFEMELDHPGWGVQVNPQITTDAVQTTPAGTPVAVLGLLGAVALAVRRLRA